MAGHLNPMSYAELRLSYALVRFSLPQFCSCLFRIFGRNLPGESRILILVSQDFGRLYSASEAFCFCFLELLTYASPEFNRCPKGTSQISHSSAGLFHSSGLPWMWDMELSASGPCPESATNTWVKWLQNSALPLQNSPFLGSQPLQFFLT